MREKKLKLPGTETITLSGQTIDKLIRTGNGDTALLYLYILRTQGQCTQDEAAAALGKGPGTIATEMANLSRMGLVILDDDPDMTPHSTVTQNENLPDKPPGQPIPEPHQYTVDEIKAELKPGSGFTIVVEETQRRLGNILSPDDLMRLFGIYDSLRLPPEVIMQLITHCISECHRSGDGRAPTMRYIEKAAYTWEREGIFTLEKAEDYLKKLEARRSERGKIKRALQIRDREFSATEKQYVDGWIDMGFNDEAVEIAYDRTILKTGTLSWKYIDTIIKSWHGKNLHAAQEILEKDGKKSGTIPKPGAGTDPLKFGAPNLEDLTRMERLLKKIKEE